MKTLLIGLIQYGYQFIWLIILANVALSWVIALQRPRWMYHPVVLWVDTVGNRLLRPFRQLLAALGLGRLPLDISPILAGYAFMLLARILVRIILQLPIP